MSFFRHLVFQGSRNRASLVGYKKHRKTNRDRDRSCKGSLGPKEETRGDLRLRVEISLPYELRIVEGDCQYKIYLESPRIMKVVTLENAWEYYDMRSVRSDCSLKANLNVPMVVTVYLSQNLKEFYECKNVKSFLEGNGDVIECKGGLLIYKGIKKLPMDFYVVTRIDVIGPRLKALTCRSR